MALLQGAGRCWVLPAAWAGGTGHRLKHEAAAEHKESLFCGEAGQTPAQRARRRGGGRCPAVGAAAPA